MAAQKCKKFVIKLFAYLNASYLKNHLIKSLKYLDSSRVYGRLLENLKIEGYKELFLPENDFQNNSIIVTSS